MPLSALVLRCPRYVACSVCSKDKSAGIKTMKKKLGKQTSTRKDYPEEACFECVFDAGREGGMGVFKMLGEREKALYPYVR